MELGEHVGYVVATDQTPTFSRMHIYLIPGKIVYPGELLAVLLEGNRKTVVFVRVVEGMFIDRYQKPHMVHLHELMGTKSISAELDRLPGKFAMVEAEVLEEAEEPEYRPHEPKSLVPPGSPVYRVNSDLAAKILGLPSEGEKGLSVGYLVGPGNAEVILDPERVLPRHILIVGSTGTGKTWLRGVLAEELHRLGIPQVHVDVHGEFVKATEELGGRNMTPGKDLTVRLSSLSELDVLELIPYLTELQAEIVRRAFLDLKAEKEGLGSNASQVRASITMDRYIESADKGANPELIRFFALIEKAAKLMRSRDETREMALARAAMLKSVKIIGPGVDWEQLINESSVINIDCRFLSATELYAVVGAVARELLEMRMHGKGRPLVLFIDEAHLFVPHGQDTPSSFVLRELIRYGRHYGIGLVLITPSPTDIDQRLVRMTNTRFIFAIEPDQLKSLHGVFADAPEDLISKLPKLEVGTCLLTGSRETVRHAVLIRVKSERKTTHGGETPKFLDQFHRGRKTWKGGKDLIEES
jgi:DNA helicase HerA-like ATPase